MRLPKHRGIYDLASQLGFSELAFIDRNGEAVLAQIITQSAEFIANGVYTKQLLGNLPSGSKRSLVKEGREHGSGNPR
jgi:hypothetical protein